MNLTQIFFLPPTHQMRFYAIVDSHLHYVTMLRGFFFFSCFSFGVRDRSHQKYLCLTNTPIYLDCKTKQCFYSLCLLLRFIYYNFRADCLYNFIHCRDITTAFPSFMMRSDFEDDINNLWKGWHWIIIRMKYALLFASFTWIKYFVFSLSHLYSGNIILTVSAMYPKEFFTLCGLVIDVEDM